MKTKHLVLLGAAGLAAWWLLKSARERAAAADAAAGATGPHVYGGPLVEPQTTQSAAARPSDVRFADSQYGGAYVGPLDSNN
jgi:hypothetical protein